jgi:hypothetical protein
MRAFGLYPKVDPAGHDLPVRFARVRAGEL